MLPGEMDAESISMLERTQRYEIHLDATYLGYLHIIAEQVAFMVKVKQSIEEVFLFNKELRLDLVTVRRRRKFRLEVIYLLIPHAEARFDTRFRVSVINRMNPLNKFAAVVSLRAGFSVVFRVIRFVISVFDEMLRTDPDRRHHF